ncbi:unnamed protein product [Effrenium voratum]|nr:unnamed protein product [Effrenium voratum]
MAAHGINVAGASANWRRLAESEDSMQPVEASAHVLAAAAALQDALRSPAGYTARRTGRSVPYLLTFLEACAQRDAKAEPPLLALLCLEQLVRSPFVDERGEEACWCRGCAVKFLRRARICGLCCTAVMATPRIGRCPSTGSQRCQSRRPRRRWEFWCWSRRTHLPHERSGRWTRS